MQLTACRCGHTVVSILTDWHAFFDYDNRENVLAQQVTNPVGDALASPCSSHMKTATPSGSDAPSICTIPTRLPSRCP